LSTDSNRHSFSLWNTPWITTLSKNRKLEELGICDCLVRAHQIREIQEIHSVYAFGVYRLLIAILQSMYGNQGAEPVRALLKAGSLPEKAIEAFGAKHAHRFDLFSKKFPFMQDCRVLPDLDTESKKETYAVSIYGETLNLSPVARMFFEMPSGINTTHFSGLYEHEQAVCPKCAAHGILAIPSFTTIGGVGYSNSINDAPPLYVLPTGATLFETLIFSIITNEKYLYEKRALTDIPLWESDNVVSDETLDTVGYCQSLLFPARRLRLFPEQTDRKCTRCGQSDGLLINNIYYAPGFKYSTLKHPRKWLDPFVAYREDTTQPSGEENRIPVRYDASRDTWKDFSYLLLGSETREDKGDKKQQSNKYRVLRPKVIENTLEILGDNESWSSFNFRVIGLHTNQAKVIQWIESGLPMSRSLFNDQRKHKAIQQYLACSFGLENAISSALFTAYKMSDSENPDALKQMRERGKKEFWAASEKEFWRFLNAITELSEPELDQAHQRSLNTLSNIARKSFNEAVGAYPYVQKRPQILSASEKTLNIKISVALKDNGKEKDA